MNIMKIITDHRLALFGIIFGPIVGVFFKDIARSFENISSIYILLMELAVIPLMIVTIVMGVLELIYSADAKSGIYKIISKILLVFSIVAIIATISSMIIRPWNDMMNNSGVLRVVYSSEPIIQKTAVGLDSIIDTDAHKGSIGEFIKSAIPSNVFQSLASGDILQIVIFFIILATSLGVATSNTDSAIVIKRQLSNMFKIFAFINDSILQFLPVMSFFVLAYQSHSISIEMFSSLFSLMLCIVTSFIAIIIVCIALIWHKSKYNIRYVIQSLFPCISLAFFSRSTLVSSSLAMDILIEKLKLNPSTVHLVVPLGAGMLRFGTASLYFIATFLAAHLFNVSLDIYEYLLLYFLAILASFVVLSANNAVAAYQVLSIVLMPLGLPGGAINSLFLALDFVTEAFEVIANVLSICALASLCAPSEKEDNKDKQVADCVVS